MSETANSSEQPGPAIPITTIPPNTVLRVNTKNGGYVDYRTDGSVVFSADFGGDQYTQGVIADLLVRVVHLMKVFRSVNVLFTSDLHSQLIIDVVRYNNLFRTPENDCDGKHDPSTVVSPPTTSSYLPDQYIQGNASDVVIPPAPAVPPSKPTPTAAPQMELMVDDLLADPHKKS